MKAFVLALLALLALAGCGSRGAAEKIPVVASFYPLREFTQAVGGDRVEVRTLVPPGAEPHDYEPTPQDVAALSRARVVVYNGAGFEPWIEKLLPDLEKRAVAVSTTEGLPLVKSAGDEPGGEEAGRAAGLDPHVWLDPVLAQRQADNIAAGLVRADPAGRAAYEANAATLTERLRRLDAALARRLGTCAKKEFITSHAAFGYLARRYGLTMIPISGLLPEVEPSPAKLKAIVRVAREHGATVIYTETLVSPRVAETIAREVGAKTLVLNPIEGLTETELRSGKTYFTVMDENLAGLAQGLDCR